MSDDKINELSPIVIEFNGMTSELVKLRGNFNTMKKYLHNSMNPEQTMTKNFGGFTEH